MAFYLDTLKNINLSRYDYNPDTKEIKLKDFLDLCIWADDQNYYSEHQKVDSYARVTRTDKKGVIIHQQLIQFPLDGITDSVLLLFDSKVAIGKAKEEYTIPQEGEVAIPELEREGEETPSISKEEVKEEEKEVEVPQEKTEATRLVEELQEKANRELSEEERHDRVTQLADGVETDDFSSEVDESDLPPVIQKESRKEYEERLEKERLEHNERTANERVAEVFLKPSPSSETSPEVTPLDLDESVVLFKQHLQEIVKGYEDERKKATATANDLIASFVAIGNGLMEGQVTYEKVGQEMKDKGQEISRIGSHINLQEKKIANIMNLNKEIDKVLQDEEEE